MIEDDKHFLYDRSLWICVKNIYVILHLFVDVCIDVSQVCESKYGKEHLPCYCDFVELCIPEINVEKWLVSVLMMCILVENKKSDLFSLKKIYLSVFRK